MTVDEIENVFVELVVGEALDLTKYGEVEMTFNEEELKELDSIVLDEPGD